MGCLYGQAIGDALGLGSEGLFRDGVEGYYPKGLTKYEQIVPDAHRRRWHQGDWTDDTDMMICIAKAIIVHNGIIDDTTLHDIASNFKAWMLSPECMGIGRLVHNVLSIGDYVDKPQEVAKMFWNLSKQQNAPNGGLMRTSVIGLLRENVSVSAENVCRLTHYDPRCVGTCAIVSEMIHSLVYQNRQMDINEIKSMAEGYDNRIVSYIDLAYNAQSIDDLELDDMKSAGYTLKTFAAGLWALLHTISFVEGMLAVVNAGGDSDTNAAVACALLGAKYGVASIPDYYKTNLYKAQEYESLVEDLMRALNLN